MKTVIEMAKEAGLCSSITDVFPKELAMFAKLVRLDLHKIMRDKYKIGVQHENDACAVTCWRIGIELANQNFCSEELGALFAKAIRERLNK